MNTSLRKWLRRIVMWVCAIAFGIILFVAAVLICTVRTLRPEHLTPIVTRYANGMLDATVTARRIGLGFKPGFPMLKLELDSLTVVSHSFDSLPESARRSLPEYSDTLLTLQRFEGTINIRKFLAGGEIALHDVRISGPALNVVIAPDGRTNFDIYRSSVDSTEVSSDSISVPAISIDRFAFENTRAIRYFNAMDSTEATVLLLRDAVLDGRDNPSYRLKIDGTLGGPIARTLLNLEGIDFGLDGKLRWTPDNPGVIAVEQFVFSNPVGEAVVDAEVDYNNELTVRHARLDVGPVEVENLLRFIPEELAKQYSLTSKTFTTDATMSLSAWLDRPFCVSSDSVPFASFALEVPECAMRLGRARFNNLTLSLGGRLCGPNLDEIVLDLKKFTIAGPATSLNVSGTATRLMSDPEFRTEITGRMNLVNLPPVVADALQGYLSGLVDANLTASGRASMFSRNNFHSLDVRGKIAGHKLYWLDNDTAKMVDINELTVNFDSQRRIRRDDASSRALLSAKIDADTAYILVDGVEISVGELSLSAASSNTAQSSDTTVIVPVGGGLSIGSLRVGSVVDKAGVRMRDFNGRVMMRRFKDDTHLPEFILDVVAGRMAAGGNGSIGMLANARIKARTHKIPERAERERQLRHLADSIGRVHPDLTPDSVIALAIAHRRHKAGTPRRRMREVQMDDYDAIDWGTTRHFRSFLRNWSLQGSLSTEHARLYTPYFPIRNRVSELDISFSTDTVEVKSLRYKAGHSDLAVTGIVSNIKRSLGSARGRSPLKINFRIESDTIDVNELAAASFAGSAYASGSHRTDTLGIDVTDSRLDKEIDALASEHPDSVGPLLIPSNVDANIAVSADNILYSDLKLRNMHGDLLVFDGAVNLNDLSAVSDAGSLRLSALYSAPRAKDMEFGFGMMLEDFKIEKFLKLVPAIDSIMPLMRDFSGTIDADLAATVKIDSAMNLELPTLDAAVKLAGDSLALINPETYRTLGKWLRFRDRADNRIKYLSMQLIVHDNRMELFPFTFDIDRYKLGVVGTNDLAMNFDYHISVLKSPLPFKFGINIKGNPDHYKVRFGGAKFKEGMVASNIAVVDTARVNLVRQIQNVFRRGVRNSRFAKLEMNTRPDLSALGSDSDNLSRNDSIALIKEGLIDASEMPVLPPAGKDAKGEKAPEQKDRNNNEATRRD